VTKYILDASVAAKWFLPPAQEDLASEALQLLRAFSQGRIGLTVPDLFWPEFGNILWKAVKLKRISREVAEHSIDAIEQLGLTTTSSKPLMRAGFGLAVTLGRTVYDGIYVALAVATDTPLVTADERLANVLALQMPVRWLGAL
jgi:predicted nucleic acid-binding protein